MAILAKSARFRGFKEKGLRPTHLFIPDTVMLDGDLVRIIAGDNIFIGNLPKKEATAMAEAIRALLR